LRKLLILHKALDTKHDDFTYYLAMSPAAMVSCNKLSVDFYSLDDFYSPDDFRIDFAQVVEKLEKDFRRLERDLDYPIFTWSIYWWITFLANFLYLREVARSITSEGFQPCFQDTPA